MADQAPAPIAHVLRVFCDDHDDHGNALGVIVDGAAASGTERRQEIAFELGFSETVFIDDRARGAVEIYTPTTQLALAGHPLVGTAWLLAHLGTPVAELAPPAGPVACGAGAGDAWIEADPQAGPPWVLTALGSPDEVDALDADEQPADGLRYPWAWIDERAGVVRARGLCRRLGIVEDEATGSAALRLCQSLGRRIEIRQGRGSCIVATPADGDRVRIAGRVVLDEELTLDI